MERAAGSRLTALGPLTYKRACPVFTPSGMSKEASMSIKAPGQTWRAVEPWHQMPKGESVDARYSRKCT